MFEYSLVPDGKARPMPIVVACLSEALLIGTVALVPLLFVQSLPERALFNALTLVAVPSAPPPPPPPMIATARPKVAAVPRKFNPEALVSPVVVPKEVAIINEAPVIEMDAVQGGVPGGIPGMTGAGGGNGIFSHALSTAPPPPPPAVKIATAPPPPAPVKQIVVGGDVEAAMLLQRIPPVYPKLALEAHIRGSVILKAVIGTDGRIKDLTAMSGHPMLVEAAIKAVRGWVYKPTILDGAPAEVKTTIEVRFNLT
jgi:protein TonB